MGRGLAVALVTKVVFLSGHSARATQRTLLLIGSGVMADSLAKVLGNQGFALQRAARDQGATSMRTLAPDLIMLAGDAAQNRGGPVLVQLNPDPQLPVL
ncbi:MAG: hypothetical protein RL701_3715, partial [Pseudomonadota bacterium]